jgi:ribosomal-protein-alanine N-acetyltransferase
MLSKDTTTLRQAHASEATAIATLSRLHIEYGLRWRWTPNRVRRSIADPETVVLVATILGEIVGFAIMKFGDLDAHLHLLAVDPKQRRSGIGRSMMTWLERSCDTAGMQHIRLEVRANNRLACRFYEELDYCTQGKIPAYYDRSEAALVYAKNLRKAPAR